MRLVSTLAAGIAQAANGTAVIYKRGTSTDAQYWNDFEGDDPVTLGTVVTLDAYGSAVVYVNELVNVLVYDSGAQLVRDFVDANAAPNTEVRSLSFTGQDYTSAASAPGNPTTLQAVLDLWETNSLAPDWKVEVNGTVYTIPDALAGLVGIYYNVKNPNYAGGAVGDGVNDDGPAIEAAIADAAANDGGVVFFPAGEYRITAQVDVPPQVSLLGTGSSASEVVLDAVDTTDQAFYFPGTAVAAQQFQSMDGLRVRTSKAQTWPLIKFLDAWLKIDECILGDESFTESAVIQSGSNAETTSCKLTMVDTVLYSAAQSGQVVSVSAFDDYEGFFSNVEFVASAAFIGSVFLGSPSRYDNCTVDLSQTTGAAPPYIFSLPNGGVVTGCTIKPGANDVVGISPPANGSAARVVESGNDWGFNSTSGASGYPVALASGSTGVDTLLAQGLRTRWRELVVADTDPIECEPIAFGVELIHKTGTSAGSNQVVNLNKTAEGHEYTLMIWNDSDTDIVFQIDEAVTDDNTHLVAQGQLRAVNFVCMSVGTEARAMAQTSAVTLNAPVPV